MANETRPQSLTRKIDAVGTRTSPGSELGGGLTQRLERVAAQVGRANRSARVRSSVAYFTDDTSGTLSGTEDQVLLTTTLPSSGLWLLLASANLQGVADIDIGDAAVVELQVYATDGPTVVRNKVHRIATPTVTGPSTVDIGTDPAFDAFFDADDASELAVRVSTDAVGNDADFDDVAVFIELHAVRLGVAVPNL